MEEIKVHILHVKEFKDNENTTESNQKIFRVYGKGVITDLKFQSWFSKFHSGNTSLRDEPTPGHSSQPDQDALRELVECNPWKKNLRISTWPQHIPIHNLPLLEKDRKVNKLVIWVPQT